MAFYMIMRSTKLSVQVAVKVFTSQVQQNKICNQNKAFIVAMMAFYMIMRSTKLSEHVAVKVLPPSTTKEDL